MISNSSYGNDGSDGLGGNTVLITIFMGRIQTQVDLGTMWLLDTPQDKTGPQNSFPEDHGQGSYWYHPHYHPSVNQQVYGGLTGLLDWRPTIQDPRLQGYSSRGLAVMKQLKVALDNGAPTLTGWDSGTGNTQYGDSELIS